MAFVISILAAYSPWVLSHEFQKDGVFSWLTLEKCSLCHSHKYFQILLGKKMAEPLETVYPCHLTQCVRSGRGEGPCLDTKQEHYLLCGEAHRTQPAWEGDWHMWVNPQSPFSFTEQSGPDTFGRKMTQKALKGGANITSAFWKALSLWIHDNHFFTHLS